MTLLTINAPGNFQQNLGKLPAQTKITARPGTCHQIHWFVRDRATMEKELPRVMKLLQDEVVCWIYYPKGTSSIQTDLTRDKGWDSLMKHTELQWISLISFDDTWSSFGMRLKKEKDDKRAARKAERPIFDYIDATTKTVRLPDDLAGILKKNKEAYSFFDSLSFTNRKEYVEWIVTAKREETREERVKGTVERLVKGWKNPRNM
jgi:hypothetical protein